MGNLHVEVQFVDVLENCWICMPQGKRSEWREELWRGGKRMKRGRLEGIITLEETLEF